MQTQAQSDYLNRSLSANFCAREFICFCCGAEGIKDALIFRLQRARDLLPVNRIMIITSGYRCEKHNNDIGGVENSAHIKGLAADIKCEDASHKFMLVKVLMKAGFNRIGIYDSFIHCDIDKNKTQMVMW